MAGSTTYNIKIVLASNSRDFGSDMGHAGDQARAAGRGIGEAGDAAKGAGKSFVSLGGLVKEAAANFAGYLSAQAVFQGLTKVVGFAKDTILGFDNQMTQSLAIMGNVSDETRKSMESTARETALKFGVAVEDVAQSYYFLASAGYDAATSQQAVGQVTAFAKAGMIDMEKATEMAADAQNAMGLKTDNAAENLVQLTRITDVLTKANIDANGSVEQFGAALTNKAAASARLANISLESTVAVLETFAAQGLKGKKAGEAFSIVLRDLQEKSRANKEEFEALGITVFDAQGAFAGFPTIIGQIEHALAGQSVEQANATLATLGFTAEGSNYIKTLIGMSGEITKYEEKLKAAGGATQQIAEKQMQSLIEKMNHLRAVAAELSLIGFDALMSAVAWLGEHFGPAFENAASAIKDAATFIAPLVTMLGKLAGGAVVGALIATAAALDKITSVLAAHSGIIEALATVGLVLLVARLGQAGVAFLSMAADAAAFKAFQFAGGIDSVIASLVAMRAAFATARAEGAGFAASMSAGMAALSLPTVALATGGLILLGLALYGVQTKLNDGERAAEAFNKEIAAKYNLSSLDGLRHSLEDTRAKMDEVGKTGSTIGDRLNIPKMIEAEGEYKKLGETVANTAAQIDARTKAFDGIARAIAESHGPSMQSAADIQLIAAQLDLIAAKEKIDPTAPGAAEKLAELTQAALFTTAPMQALHDAFMSVAAAGSTAEDALKAYQTALQSLFGVHIAAQQAENAFAASLDTVHGAVTAGTNLMDAYGASNRAARDAVLGSADGAMKHAVSVFEETGSIDAATAALGTHIEQLVHTMMTTGMSEAAARAYIATLHLTPKDIESTAHLNKDQAEAAARGLDAQYTTTARDRYTTMHVEVGAAIANLNTLQAKLNLVASLGRQGDIGASGYALGRTLAGNSQGGVTLHQYASGGVESHIATMAPAGAMRLWAEPETGGEAYIPLSMGKRGRSVQVLASVAQMFGFQLMRYAQGGMSGGISASSTMPGVMISPGAVQVSVVNPSSGTDVETAVGRALNAWTRTMRTEIRTRRYTSPGGL